MLLALVASSKIWIYCLLFDTVFLFIAGDKQNVPLENCTSIRADMVDLSECNLTHVDPHYFEDHRYLTMLDMSQNQHFQFPLDGSPFLYHPTLLHYYCEFCGITAVYELTFSELRQLRTLSLRGNRIQHIPANAFNFNWIESLNLADNQIGRLNDNHELETMQNLRKLNVSGNLGFELNGLSMDFRELWWVDCRKCGLEYLNAEWFGQVKKLKKLNLDDNFIREIPGKCFSENDKLKSVVLSGNPLKRMNFESQNLEHLHCSNCSMIILDKDSFINMPNLRVLNLAYNEIKSVENNTFERNNNLHSVLLDHNNLTEFPIQSLKRLRSLEVLCVDFNRFHPTGTLSKFKRLYNALNLRQGCAADDNWLYHFENLLPESVHEGEVLYEPDFPPCEHEVNLTYRNIAWIHPMGFVNCSYLTKLFMDFNKNFSFPKHKPFLHSDTLESYSCLHCAIEVLYPETFLKIPELNSIALRNNHLKKITHLDILTTVPNLKGIDLADNHLDLLPSEIFMHHKFLTTTIDVSRNRHLWRDFKLPILDQSWVTILLASHCGIHHITPITISLMPSLQELDLSSNPIRSIAPNAFQNNVQLLKLVLTDTHLRVLPTVAVEYLTNLKQLCMFSMPQYDLQDDKTKANNVQLGALMKEKKWCCLGGEIFLKALMANHVEAKSVDNAVEVGSNSCIHRSAVGGINLFIYTTLFILIRIGYTS
ncbi:chaoptin isoform X2 [Aedes albopictus]|uniref:Uncharacterized protein n=1 Tax=Aedes albopictus TaxID=7160 RepID=A0ABM2A177_AEDAL